MKRALLLCVVMIGRTWAADCVGGVSRDCNANLIPDECDMSPTFASDRTLNLLSVRDVADVALTHLDGDLLPDLVTVDPVTGNVSVLSNDGEGAFFSARQFATGEGTWRVESGDFDADGAQDLVVLNRNADRVSVFLNRDGMYSVQAPVPAGVRSEEILVDDVNGDGHLDVVTSSTASQGLTVAFNNGNIAFTSAEIDLERRPAQVASGDIDGDGRVDLITGSFQAELDSPPPVLWVIPNLGSEFGEPIRRPLPWGGRYIAAADVDADGYVDVVTTTNNQFAVLWGDSGGEFEQTVHSGASGVYQLSIIDLDGDSYLDIGISRFDRFLGFQNTHDREFTAAGVVPGARSFSIADLDGDGDADLAGADDGWAMIARDVTPPGVHEPIFLRLSQKSFQVIDRDFNADGKIDLAFENVEAESFAVLLNDGGGEFTSAACFKAGGIPSGFGAGDLDRDGDEDILIADEESFSIHVHWNDGSGLFEKGPIIAMPEGFPPSAVAVWDFDRDGDADVACASPWKYSIVLLRNDGEAGFQTELVKASLSRPQSVVAGDFDGDGAEELAVDWFPGLVLFRWSAGSGLVEERSGGVASRLSDTFDLDGDGRLDLLGWGAEVHRNTGHGSFPLRWWVASLSWSVVGCDLDGDGSPELVTSSNTDYAQFYVLTATSPALSRDANGNGIPDECDLVENDCNKNGIVDLQDIASGTSDDCNANDLPDECDLEPAPAFTRALPFGDAGNPYGIAAGDFDGDDHVDVAAVNTRSDHVFVFLSDRSLTLRDPVSYRILANLPNESSSSSPRAIAAADFDGDGSLDLATANEGRYTISQLGGSVTVLWNLGLGSFIQAGFMPAGAQPVDVAAADLDGDGDTDLVTANDSSPVSVLMNSGARAFEPALDLPVAGSSQLAVGDLDGDNDPDLAVLAGSVKFLSNAGDGTFAGSGALTPAESGRALDLGDLDGDGDQDLTVASGSFLQPYTNGGGGDFTPAGPPLFAATPFRIENADLDGDGDGDLIASQSDSISVRSNLGDGTFDRSLEFPTGKHPLSLVVVDLDAENGPDVVVGVGEDPSTEHSIAVLLNYTAWSADCDGNGVPDECDLSDGTLQDGNGDGIPDACVARLTFGLETPPPAVFHRGDTSGEGRLDIGDPVLLLNYLFVGGVRPGCREAADFDNDAELNITDALGALNYLFLGGSEPASPGPAGAPCGPDPDPQGSAGDLGCGRYEGCSEA